MSSRSSASAEIGPFSDEANAPLDRLVDDFQVARRAHKEIERTTNTDVKASSTY